jgi:hypothetical protein
MQMFSVNFANMNKWFFLVPLLLSVLLATIPGLCIDTGNQTFVAPNTDVGSSNVHQFEKKQGSELELVHLIHNTVSRTVQLIENYCDNSQAGGNRHCKIKLLNMCSSDAEKFNNCYLIHNYPSHSFW